MQLEAGDKKLERVSSCFCNVSADHSDLFLIVKRRDY